MRRRSRTIQSDNVASASLDELNREIAHMEWRAQNGKLRAELRRSALLRLLWLEAERERLFGVPAPTRRRR